MNSNINDINLFKEIALKDDAELLEIFFNQHRYTEKYKEICRFKYPSEECYISLLDKKECLRYLFITAFNNGAEMFEDLLFIIAKSNEFELFNEVFNLVISLGGLSNIEYMLERIIEIYKTKFIDVRIGFKLMTFALSNQRKDLALQLINYNVCSTEPQNKMPMDEDILSAFPAHCVKFPSKVILKYRKSKEYPNYSNNIIDIHCKSAKKNNKMFSLKKMFACDIIIKFY